MLGWLARNVLNILGLPGDFAVVGAILPASVVAAVSAVSAYAAGLGWHEILFWAGGVFLFVGAGLYYGRRALREASIFQQLIIDEAAPFAAIDPKLQANISIQLVFRNASTTRLLVMQPIRARLTLQTRNNPDESIKSKDIIIPPNTVSRFTFANVSGIDGNLPITGRLELELAYGPSLDKLRYRLNYISEPVASVVKDVDGKIGLFLTMPVLKYEHQVAKPLRNK